MCTAPKLLELKPDYSLLNSDFDGYKLSLQQISTIRQDLKVAPERLLPKPSQYSLLNTKLFGFHNHLVGERSNNTESVYFIDKSWNIKKFHYDLASHKLVEETLWQIICTGKPDDFEAYMPTIKLCNDKLALVADGLGSLFILKRNTFWDLQFSGEVIGPERGFVLSDAIFKQDLHVLLTRIEHDLTVINWVTFREIGGKFEQVALRELQVRGYVQYLCFEASCDAIYVISDASCIFTLDSEKKVSFKEPKYTWTQSPEQVTVKVPASNVEKQEITVDTGAHTIEITVKEGVVLKGALFKKIQSNQTTWSLEDDCLAVNLTKQTSEIWPDLVKDNSAADDTPQGVTFNSQQIEECDFELDKFSIFERVTKDHETSHKINLGSHQILCTTSTYGFGVRSDVDTCIYQPSFMDDFRAVHKGTLLAMGYIQASKQQRKFFACSPDFSYSVICESSKHVFVYRQSVMVASGELRNRATGKRIGSVAQQFVVNLEAGHEEILGVYAAQEYLFLLGETFLMCLQFSVN